MSVNKNPKRYSIKKFPRKRKFGKHYYNYNRSSNSIRNAECFVKKFKAKNKNNQARIKWSRKRLRYEVFTRTA